MEYEDIIDELEKQRYNSIKKSGKYLEFNVLISGEDDMTENDRSYKVPVISLKAHDIGPKEIGCLYISLLTFLEQYEKDHPVECLVAKLSIVGNNAGEITLPDDDDEED